MVPIAVMPAAALLLRLGAPDLLNIPFMSAAGAAVFDNLAILFAAGIAIGMSDDHRGEAVLAAIVGFYVLIAATQSLLTAAPPLGAGYAADDALVTQLANNVLIGILAGLVAVWTYNRFRKAQLPAVLGFFSGRRLTPILTSLFVLILAVILRFAWPPLWNGISSFNSTILDLGAVGTGIFGFMNRALLPLGLHHVLNAFFWFGLGEYVAANGAVVSGDIPRFLSGDPTAGAYQVGFYPIMMFGLMGAALAMIVLAKSDRRKATAGLLGGAALVSFVTGITEPLEFSFMFVAPVLYFVHALFTALSSYLTNFMGLRHGFGFSAGLIDYLLNFGLAEGPLELAAVGGGFFLLYFVVFYGLIRAFNLKTPGREAVEDLALTDDDLEGVMDGISDQVDTRQAQARGIVAALGGPANLVAVDNCATRLRLTVRDADMVNEKALKALGAKGVVKPSSKAVQVIMGVDAEFVADAVHEVLDSGPSSSSDAQWPLPDTAVRTPTPTPEVAPAPPAAAAPVVAASSVAPEVPVVTPPIRRKSVVEDPAVAASVNLMISALGGADNIIDAGAAATTRLRVVVADITEVNEDALRAAGASGVLVMDNTIHILLGMRAGQFGAEMEARLLEARR
jgi:PTS system N-acetylglucosamine-specific IIC component